jgi:hypothetical protein
MAAGKGESDMFGLFYITRDNWKAEYIGLRRVLEEMANELADAQIGKHDLQKRLDQIAAQETPGANATVKRMAAIARGEEPKPAKRKAVKRVEAGPVPPDTDLDNLRNALSGAKHLDSAFVFDETHQGHDYWAQFAYPRKPLNPEARAIIETWIAELEAKAPERTS